MFKSAVKGYSRKVEQSARQMARAARGEPYKGDVKGLMYQAFLYHTVLPVVFQYVSLWFPGILTTWDDEDKESLMWAGALGNFNSVFLIGDMLSGLKDYAQGKPWGKEITFGALDHMYDKFALNLVDLIKGLMDTKDRSAFLEATANLDFDYLKDDKKVMIPLIEIMVGVAELRGVPVETAAKWVANTYKLATGDVNNPEEIVMRIMNSSEYFIEDVNPPASSTVAPKPAFKKGYKKPKVVKSKAKAVRRTGAKKVKKKVKVVR